MLKNAQKRIAHASKSHKIIVEKSTAPIGTAEKIKETLKANNDNVDFEVISNPEFLAEGSAINDLIDPDRVLIGSNQTNSGIKAMNQIVEIYNNWIDKKK